MGKAAARQMLNAVYALDGGDQECAVCHRCAWGKRIDKVVSSAFTNWDLVSAGKAAHCCGACEMMFGTWAYRNKVLLATALGITAIDQAGFREEISAPSRLPQVFTWPTSRQKHCWLNADISDAETLRIGGDDRTIVMPRAAARAAMDIIDKLYATGATKIEVRTGMYRSAVVQRWGHEIEAIEDQLRPLRFGGGLDVLVWCCERPQGSGKGDVVMLDDDDRRAAELLARLANGSGMRATDPMGFWGAGYLTRLNRQIGARSLKEMIEGLARDLGIPSHHLRATVVWVEAQGGEAEGAMLSRIKRSPRILVAMSQEIARTLRPGASLSRSGGSALTGGADGDLDDPIPNFS